MRKRIFFVHIAKAAGTSVNEVLSREIGVDESLVHAEAFPGSLDNLKYGEEKRYRFISGHIRLPEILKRIDREQWIVFTLLREPVSHLISHLKWVKHIGMPEEKNRRERHSKDIQELSVELSRISLNDVAEVARVIYNSSQLALELFDNCQCRYLIPAAKGRIEAEHLNAAMIASHNLDVVGVTEFPERALSEVFRLADVACGDVVEVPSSNMAPSREIIELESAEIREFYSRAVLFDYELYQYALNRWVTF